MEQNIFDSFPPNTTQEWINQATKELKGKDFEKTLVSYTLDGIRIEPIYHWSESEKRANVLENAFHGPSSIPGLPPRIWSNVSSIKNSDDKVANTIIIEDLHQGSDAILLNLTGKENLDVLLKNVGLQYIEVYIRPIGKPEEVLRKFLNWTTANDFQPEEIRGGFLFNPMLSCFERKGSLEDVSESLCSLMELAKDFPDFKSISLQMALLHNSGASAAQEMGIGFSGFLEMVHILTEKGYAPKDIFLNTLIHDAAGSSFFEEIAKLKSNREFFFSLGILYGVSWEATDIRLFVETSHWTKSKFDSSTNMLRNTTEAMSAILGGCNALWVQPHDLNQSVPDAFSRRMARNISNILKEESYLDKVMDPAAGSYFLEELGRKILEKTKEKVKEIENEGGFWKVLETGKIQSEVRAMRQRQWDKLDKLDKIKVGVNKFQIPSATDLEELSKLPVEASWQLLPMRESMQIETQKQGKA